MSTKETSEVEKWYLSRSNKGGIIDDYENQIGSTIDSNRPTESFLRWIEEDCSDYQKFLLLSMTRERDELTRLLDNTLVVSDGHESRVSELESLNSELQDERNELLEALKAVYSDIDLDKHGSSELNNMVQSAIARAEKGENKE